LFYYIIKFNNYDIIINTEDEMNNKIEAVIEIPLKTKNKFEIDHEHNRIKLDRVLYSAMTYPAEYGYIEDTLALDEDPLDILVISSEPTFPGCVVPTRVLGYLAVIDRGFEDYKLISVVDVDPRYNQINELSDLSPFTLEEIKNFFENYKTLQNIKVEVKDYHSKEEALELIESCQKRYTEGEMNNV
jgi:inorganic pyrophosphatase